MTLKLIFTTSLSLALTRLSSSGLVPYHQHHSVPQEDNYHHASVASSYMHFHGPVEGHEYEVKVPYVLPHDTEQHHNGLEHGQEQEHHHLHHQGYTLDYFANPKYEFSYGVEDHHTGDFHEQKEVRDGDNVAGSYSVKDHGMIRTVTYKADKDGFHAVVSTSGKNDHSGGTYGAHHHQIQSHQVLQQSHVVEQPEEGEAEEESRYQFSPHDPYAPS